MNLGAESKAPSASHVEDPQIEQDLRVFTKIEKSFLNQHSIGNHRAASL
jgi:hypothetical protein